MLGKISGALKSKQSAILSKLMMLYRSGTTDEGRFLFGVRAAVLQLAAAVCDPVYLKQTLSSVLVAVACGLVVMLTTDISHPIWLGLMVVPAGVVLGSVVASTLCDGYGLSQTLRRLIWLATAVLCVGCLYVPARSLVGIDVLWLLFVSLITIFFIALTEANFGDRWHFERFQKDERAETLQAYLHRDLRGPVIRLKAIDKYTYVLTEKGGCEIRMPLRRAIDLCDAPGISIHRSHWVARQKLSTPSRVGRRWVMIVEGETLPVSESRLPEIELMMSGQAA